MAYIMNGKKALILKKGESFEFENPCDGFGHSYSDHICPKCGRDFCFSCCGNTNVHEGGKYHHDFMNCPDCGHDIYMEIK